MYKKAFLLFQQIEHDEVNADRAKTLLESLLEQGEAFDSYDVQKIAQMALERLPGLREGRRMAIASLVELLAFAFAEPTIETIEKAVTKMAKLDYEKIEKYRDEGVVTEHFTSLGNVFCLVKFDRKTPGGHMPVKWAAYLKGTKVGVVSLKPENTLAEAMTVVDILLANNE